MFTFFASAAQDMTSYN